MSSLGDIARPTSRVLRPPGGGSSNIFGETDNSSTKKSPNAKPTYQSSVFSSGLEPEKPKSATRPDRMSSNIFGTDNNDNQTSTNAKKVSKTHQSSLFQEPEPLSEEKKKAAMKNNISNIPMFNANSPEEAKSSIRRPVTAPTHMPQGSSLNLFSTMNHATDNKPGPGEKTITRTGYKPANANLRSSVFNLQKEKERIGRQHYPQFSFKPTLMDIPDMPRVKTKPLHRNEMSSLFPVDDFVQIKNDCQKRPMSATYRSKIFSNSGGLEPHRSRPFHRNEISSVFAQGQVINNEVKPVSDTYQSHVFQNQDTASDERFERDIFSADGSMVCLTKQKSVHNMSDTQSFMSSYSEIAQPPQQIWSTADYSLVGCPRRAQCSNSKKMSESSLFKEEQQGYTPPLWSSDHHMSSCKSVHSAVSNDTYKSTVFSPDHKSTWRANNCYPNDESESTVNDESLSPSIANDMINTAEYSIPNCPESVINDTCDAVSSASINSTLDSNFKN
uniref:uncharacterized protein LOC120340743 isoform X1 n=1 Tax=Styela clava TaxID=7725 RepID=UPI00193A4022|nr:uncharacterized protein LOC120340743 isoform X1 [Styela clava]